MNSYDAYDLMYKTGVSNLTLEKIISKDCDYSWCYAIHVLKSRFRLGEKAIIQNMSFNYYCNYLVKVMGYNHE